MTDKLKLALAILIVAIGIGGFYYFSERELIQWLTLLAAAGIALAVAMQSAQGKAAWAFAKEARLELRKVVWPSSRETMQVTITVFVLVVLVALFLWAVDWVLLKIVQALTGQGGGG
jgi:preprotein translocase subunit SecE